LGLALSLALEFLSSPEQPRRSMPVRRYSFLHLRRDRLCLCGLATLNFPSMIPVAGSAYTYATPPLGEIFAWIIGWDFSAGICFRPAATVASG